MPSFNDFFNTHLNFTTREKTGILGLLILMVLFYFLPILLHKEEDYSKELKIFEKEMELLEKDTLDIRTADKSSKYQKLWAPFYFNPNTVEAKRLENFGFPPFLIARFAKYRLAGAKFYKKQDLLKIYGLDKSLYLKTEPYIVFDQPSKGLNAKDSIRKKVATVKQIYAVELNEADSLSLIAIDGIGPYLSSKILSYRDALGGFVSTNQLYEIYTIKPEQVERIKPFLTCDKTKIKRLNVNTADYDALNRHPYISGKQAKAILNYRLQHGRYSSYLDLEKVILLNKETLQKLEFYLEF